MEKGSCDLNAVFFNGTLKRSPQTSNTQGLIEAWKAGTRFDFENPEYR
jgi:hypothetical protein